jgi:hypothetical protein
VPVSGVPQAFEEPNRGLDREPLCRAASRRGDPPGNRVSPAGEGQDGNPREVKPRRERLEGRLERAERIDGEREVTELHLGKSAHVDGGARVGARRMFPLRSPAKSP